MQRLLDIVSKFNNINLMELQITDLLIIILLNIKPRVKSCFKIPSTRPSGVTNDIDKNKKMYT